MPITAAMPTIDSRHAPTARLREQAERRARVHRQPPVPEAVDDRRPSRRSSARAAVDDARRGSTHAPPPTPWPMHRQRRRAPRSSSPDRRSATARRRSRTAATCAALVAFASTGSLRSLRPSAIVTTFSPRARPRNARRRRSGQRRGDRSASSSARSAGPGCAATVDARRRPSPIVDARHDEQIGELGGVLVEHRAIRRAARAASPRRRPTCSSARGTARAPW